MPCNAAPDPRSSKKRKTKEPAFLGDGPDPGLAGRDSSRGLRLGRGRAPYDCDKKAMQKLNLQETVEELPKSVSLKPFTEKCLKVHMESVLSEVNEARERLFQWWRQEVQAILDVADERRVSDAHARKSNNRGDCASIRDFGSARSHACERANPDSEKLGPGKRHAATTTSKGHVYTCSDDNKKACEDLSVHHKPVVIDVALESATSKAVNELEQNNASDKAAQKATALANNMMGKMPSESKSSLFDSCLGPDLGVNTKDVEGLDGTLESGISMQEGFESNKLSPEIQKDLDGLERLGETKNSLFEMGFGDEESNEGNGVGCSLESAASSKVNSGCCKENIDVSNDVHKEFGAGFVTCLDEQGGDNLALNGGPEGCSGGAAIFALSNFKKEIMCEEGKHAVIKEEPVHFVGEGSLDEESRHVDTVIQSKSSHLKESSVLGVGSVAQVNPPKNFLQQGVMDARSGCGVQSSQLAALTFKGLILECKPDVLQNTSARFADTFNSEDSSILLVKDPVQLPDGDKAGSESLILSNRGDTFAGTGIAPSSGNILTTSKNGMSQILQDSKAVHLEYASRSRLGDAMLGCGKTVDYQGFDLLAGYNSPFKPATDMVDGYQQEGAAANSMYLSSLCTNNSVYLPTSNRVVGVQRSALSTPPSSGPVSGPMLMGIPTHLGGYHDQAYRNPSNMHSFLGLAMNGVPAVANGMQVFSGLYLQNNQQHNQGPYKNSSQSASSVVSHRDNSAAQEKATIELNF